MGTLLPQTAAELFRRMCDVYSLFAIAADILYLTDKDSIQTFDLLVVSTVAHDTLDTL